MSETKTYVFGNDDQCGGGMMSLLAPLLHRTLIVLCPSSSPSQFLNTLTHELLHTVTHISDYYSIPLNTEFPCYLLGSLAQASYPVAKHYL